MKGKTIFIITVLSTLLLLIFGCSKIIENNIANFPGDNPTDSKIKIAFSQCQSSDPWRIAQINDIKRAAKEHGYDLIYTDAGGDTAKQIEDVKYICQQGVDYLIYAPREYEASAAALKIAKDAGVQVILIDRLVRGTVGEDYITYITTDFFWEGKEAGKWLANKLDGKANIIEIRGTIDSSAARDRRDGFMEVVNDNQDMNLIASQSANFSRSEAQIIMENILRSSTSKIDAVFAHNDEMALGVLYSIKGAGFEPGEDIIVVSCDGQSNAVKAIIAGELGCTVTCNPYYGDITFKILEKIISGEEVKEKYILEDVVIDNRNAEEMLQFVH